MLEDKQWYNGGSASRLRYARFSRFFGRWRSHSASVVRVTRVVDLDRVGRESIMVHRAIQGYLALAARFIPLSNGAGKHQYTGPLCPVWQLNGTSNQARSVKKRALRSSLIAGCMEQIGFVSLCQASSTTGSWLYKLQAQYCLYSLVGLIYKDKVDVPRVIRLKQHENKPFIWNDQNIINIGSEDQTSQHIARIRVSRLRNLH